MPPLRRLSLLLMRLIDKKGKIRLKISTVINEIEYLARRKNVWLDHGWTIATVTTMWSTIWLLVDPYLHTQTVRKNGKTSEDKIRQVQTSWHTFYNKLIKDGKSWLASKNVGPDPDGDN